MKVKVYAKLNLTLNVGAKQGAFHPIDSVVTSVDICDVVEVVARTDMQVNVYGINSVEQDKNTAYKAAMAFRREFAAKTIPGVDIFIQKGIPFGGGLGGSSADASAVVYCMCKLFGVDIHSRKIHELCSALGSDINFMLIGGLARMQGKGDDVIPYKLAKPLCFALTTFDFPLSSKEMYDAYDLLLSNSRFNPDLTQPSRKIVNETLLMLLENGDLQARNFFSNDLQRVILSIRPKEYLEKVSKYYNVVSKLEHDNFATMTGSGSAHYIALETKKDAERLAEQLNAHGFATTVCTSVPSGIVEF